MSRNADVRTPFGAEPKQHFRLGLGQIDELEETTGYGLKMLLGRVTAGLYRVRDVRETLRLGLIGAGMTPLDSLKLIERYAPPGQIVDCEEPAKAILLAALVGNADDPPGDDDAGETTGRTTTATRPSPTAD